MDELGRSRRQNDLVPESDEIAPGAYHIKKHHDWCHDGWTLTTAFLRPGFPHQTGSEVTNAYTPALFFIRLVSFPKCRQSWCVVCGVEF
jgi:hypothetical protein